MEGEPLDVQRLLYTPEGKPRLVDPLDRPSSDDAERMFFVTILLNEVIAWMRTQSGTIEPAGDALHGRGVRLFPADGQSAVEDADADAAQAGAGVRPGRACWRRRTRSTSTTRGCRTPARGSWAGCRPSATRPACSRDWKGRRRRPARRSTAKRWRPRSPGLGNRVFLMNNVHEDAPVVFQTRWALSYLRGPLTRAQIQTLMAAARRPSPPDRGPTDWRKGRVATTTSGAGWLRRLCGPRASTRAASAGPPALAARDRRAVRPAAG